MKVEAEAPKSAVQVEPEAVRRAPPVQTGPGGTRTLARAVGNQAFQRVLAAASDPGRSSPSGAPPPTRGRNPAETGLAGLRSLLAADPGSSPPPQARSAVERATGTSVSSVRVHAGPRVDTLTEQLGSIGMSVGQHVLLHRGAGEVVLRHELAHTSQTAGRKVDLARPLSLGGSDTRAERHAHAVARGAASGILSGKDPQVVRGWDFDAQAQSTAEWAADRAEADRQERLRTQAWQALVDRQHEGARRAQVQTDASGRPLDGLTQDIEQSEFALMAARMSALTRVADRLPANLSEQWAAATQAVEMLRPTLDAEEVSVDVEEEVRPALEGFYWGMIAHVAETDRTLMDFYRLRMDSYEAATRHEARLWQQCPTAMCHAGPRENLLRDYEPFRIRPTMPEPQAPTQRLRLERLLAADTKPGWRRVVEDFTAASADLHRIVVGMLPQDAPERQALEHAEGLHTRQQQLQARRPDAVKIPAMFYPRNELGTRALPSGVEGPPEQIAQGYPWFFYLYREGGTWVLEDLTTGRKVNRRTPTLQSSLEEHFRQQQGLPVQDPPLDLFGQLNSKLRFPKGMLYLTLPSGRTHALETTEPWEWSEFLTWVGIGAVALGFVLLTAGYGTPAAIAFIGAAGAGALSTYAGLQEKELHGMATDRDRRNAAILIAADIASAFSLGLGRIAGSVRAVSALGRAGSLAGRLWAPVTAASLALDAAGLYVMTDEFVTQLTALDTQPGLTDEQRSDARRRLVLTSMVTGGLAIISLRGTALDLRRGMPLHLDATPDGFRVAPDATVARAGPAGEAAPRPGAAAEGGGGVRWQAPEVTVRGTDDTLGAGDIVINVQRDRSGLVAAVDIVPGPRPRDRARAARWDQDMALHQEIGEHLRGYGGLQGRIRLVLRRVSEILTGRRRPPLELELELYKLERAIEVRTLQLQQGNLSSRVRREIRDEVRRITTRLEEAEALIGRPDAADVLRGQIAIRGSPAGHPPAPAGHTYYYRRATDRWELRRERGAGADTPQHFRVERDPTGSPTGRLTNSQQLQESGVLGRSVTDPTTVEQLRVLGYQVDSRGRISRPPHHSGGEARPYMEPLTVRSDGTVGISARESFAEAQQRIEQQLSRGQARKLERTRAAAAADAEVVLLRGLHDTGARWADVLAGGHADRLRTGLIARGVPPATANRYVDDLLAKTDTLKVVLGTTPLRQFDYRAAHQAAAGPIPAGRQVHHFDPLYLGGSHRNVGDLPENVHDWVHRFFDDLRLPASASPPGVRLEPNSLQRAVPSWRPAAATLQPTGDIRYDTL